VNTDKRGEPRPNPEGSGTACDIGAFEYQGVVQTATPTPTPTATPTATPTPTPTATATPTGVTLMPSTLDFATIAVGKSSAASVVTLSNGTAKQIAIRLTTIGRDFVVTGTTCSSTLNAGQSCDYSMSFKPRSAGTKSEVFKLTSNTGKNSPSTNLHGVATSK